MAVDNTEDDTSEKYSEECPKCGEFKVKVGTEAVCFTQNCGWSEDRRHTHPGYPK